MPETANIGIAIKAGHVEALLDEILHRSQAPDAYEFPVSLKIGR